MERSTRSATLSPMKLIAAAAPGVVALVLATVALIDEDEAERVDVSARTGTVTAPADTATTPRVAAAPLSFAELYDRVDGVVARVDARRAAEDPPFDNGRRVATGAAFLVD